MRLSLSVFIILIVFTSQAGAQSCPGTVYTKDWDTESLGVDPRDNTFTAADVEMRFTSIDLYGHVSLLEISNKHQGANSILWQQTITNSNEYALATIGFSQPVSGFCFSIFDIDKGSFEDSITVNGYSDGRLVSLAASDLTLGSTVVYAGSNTVMGTAFIGDASADGNATFCMPESIDSLVILYNNNTPGTFQEISIHDFYWCGSDIDYDRVLNILDGDDDNDGIPDSDESNGFDGSADADGDNLPDYLDSDHFAFIDANADGVSDFFDSDMDGVPNHLDKDSDNDGIPDAVEANGGIMPANMGNDGRYSIAYVQSNDTDADGIVNDLDLDNGGVLLADPDTDSDGVKDRLDLDSDGDGVTDVIETGGEDADGNGLIDGFSDGDKDGLASAVDNSEGGFPVIIRDFDLDTIPNYRDVDSDRDGVPDNVEAQSITAFVVASGTDTDGDGIDDSFDPDHGGAIVLQDTDGDGRYDFLDGDSDGDGIRDFVEAHDANADGIQDRNERLKDMDGDGLDNAFDPDTGGAIAVLQDTDGDGVNDWRDVDDDNDGIPTIREDANLNGEYHDDFSQGGTSPDYLFATNDMDGDGVPNTADADDNNDGIPDVEQGVGVDPGMDADGDGIANFLDPDFIHPTLGAFTDSNSDGINDIFDQDMDGIANHFDLDNDNDGISNAVEANGGTLPPNMDDSGSYTASYVSLNDLDGDGLVNDIDPDNGGTALSLPDSDGDGIADYLDIDSDADGIKDQYELANTDPDADGLPNYLDADSDGDGITDLKEGQVTTLGISPSGIDGDADGLDDAFDADRGGVAIQPVDTDQDGLADYVDTDSDNDSVMDVVEGHDADSDGVADTLPAGTDLNSNGLDDAYDTAMGGTPAALQTTGTGSEPDFRNDDDDSDGILSVDEILDADPADGISDYLQASSNPCGGGFALVNYNGNLSSIIRTNGVTGSNNTLGAPDYNGTTGSVATFGTSDWGLYDLGDFVPAGEVIRIYMVTSTGDEMLVAGTLDQVKYNGLITYQQSGGGNTYRVYNYTVAGNGTRYLYFQRNSGTIYLDAVSYSFNRCLPDTDNDGVRDEIDQDDDNDGIPDLSEVAYTADPSIDSDMDGKPNYMDSDQTGFVDSNYDGIDDQADYDLDGIPNHLDLDSDNDAVADAIEANNGILPQNMSTSTARYPFAYLQANDDDKDGLANDVESVPLSLPDTDGDGLRDLLDLDSDGDGLTDTREAGGTDINGDGKADHYGRRDKSGARITADGILTIVTDTDADGAPDYLQLDSDSDGVPDIIEGHDYNLNGFGDWDANNNMMLDGPEGSSDTDGDGLADAFDPDNSSYVGALIDGDNDGLPNFRDPDDDNDGIPTASEDGNSNGIFTDDYSNGQTGPYATTPDYLYNGLTVLPVELLYFRAEEEVSSVLLSWVTLKELHNDRFEIQRADAHLNFERIGEVQGVAYSDEAVFYEYSDNAPMAGTNYYRLRQVDFDGTAVYSEVVRVDITLPRISSEAQVYPNPYAGYGNLTLVVDNMSVNTLVNVSITDGSGRMVTSLSLLSNADSKVTLQPDMLPVQNGAYMITWEINGSIYHKRLIINR
ncbi:T9SS type A sorting domain-containing protein [Roseivirga sp. BDSF3-8]|uniref:T9SS type A sorting domain-containing protein n=1 Tax=Roseivirga sp. BDSF3-8 TaxID=3241598 RepID=UPI003531DB7C